MAVQQGTAHPVAAVAAAVVAFVVAVVLGFVPVLAVVFGVAAFMTVAVPSAPVVAPAPEF